MREADAAAYRRGRDMGVWRLVPLPAHKRPLVITQCQCVSFPRLPPAGFQAQGFLQPAVHLAAILQRPEL